METITIELEENILLQVCLLAHKRDITLNVLINNILREYMEKHGDDKVSTNEVNKDDDNCI